MKNLHRCNLEEDDDGTLRLCRGNHEKHEPCEWERYVAEPDNSEDPFEQLVNAERERYFREYLRLADNLEGPPRTPDEPARNARELDAVAPTPAEKFRSMFGTDERRTMLELLDYPNPEGLHPAEARWRDLARSLKSERDELRERVEQVIGHWRNTDWFREGTNVGPDISVGVCEADARELLKFLKP